ncbi:hypothetical protein Slin14017_G069320 [Septoria linicola]|nr:hypothetical protein Slin14017_G069320 [Septoria linicola]
MAFVPNGNVRPTLETMPAEIMNTILDFLEPSLYGKPVDHDVNVYMPKDQFDQEERCFAEPNRCFGALSLVSRKMAHASQPSLYRKIRTDGLYQQGKLMLLLRTFCEAPKLASHVRTFDMRLTCGRKRWLPGHDRCLYSAACGQVFGTGMTPKRFTSAIYKGCGRAAAIMLLGMVPKLYTLDMRTKDNDYCFACPDIWAILALSTQSPGVLQTLRSLQIVRLTLHGRDLSDSDVLDLRKASSVDSKTGRLANRTIRAAPKISSLKISGTPGLSDLAQLVRSCEALNELCIEYVDPSEEYSGSPAAADVDELCVALYQHKGSLKTLHLNEQCSGISQTSTTNSSPLLHDLQTFAKLKHFTVAESLIGTVVDHAGEHGRYYWQSLIVADSLPKPLEHLIITCVDLDLIPSIAMGSSSLAASPLLSFRISCRHFDELNDLDCGRTLQRRKRVDHADVPWAIEKSDGFITFRNTSTVALALLDCKKVILGSAETDPPSNTTIGTSASMKRRHQMTCLIAHLYPARDDCSCWTCRPWPDSTRCHEKSLLRQTFE